MSVGVLKVSLLLFFTLFTFIPMAHANCEASGNDFPEIHQLKNQVTPVLAPTQIDPSQVRTCRLKDIQNNESPAGFLEPEVLAQLDPDQKRVLHGMADEVLHGIMGEIWDHSRIMTDQGWENLGHASFKSAVQYRSPGGPFEHPERYSVVSSGEPNGTLYDYLNGHLLDSKRTVLNDYAIIADSGLSESILLAQKGYGAGAFFRTKNSKYVKAHQAADGLWQYLRGSLGNYDSVKDHRDGDAYRDQLERGVRESTFWAGQADGEEAWHRFGQKAKVGVNVAVAATILAGAAFVTGGAAIPAEISFAGTLGATILFADEAKNYTNKVRSPNGVTREDTGQFVTSAALMMVPSASQLKALKPVLFGLGLHGMFESGERFWNAKSDLDRVDAAASFINSLGMAGHNSPFGKVRILRDTQGQIIEISNGQLKAVPETTPEGKVKWAIHNKENGKSCGEPIVAEKLAEKGSDPENQISFRQRLFTALKKTMQVLRRPASDPVTSEKLTQKPTTEALAKTNPKEAENLSNAVEQRRDFARAPEVLAPPDQAFSAENRPDFVGYQMTDPLTQKPYLEGMRIPMDRFLAPEELAALTRANGNTPFASVARIIVINGKSTLKYELFVGGPEGLKVPGTSADLYSVTRSYATANEGGPYESLNKIVLKRGQYGSAVQEQVVLVTDRGHATTELKDPTLVHNLRVGPAAQVKTRPETLRAPALPEAAQLQTLPRNPEAKNQHNEMDRAGKVIRASTESTELSHLPDGTYVYIVDERGNTVYSSRTPTHLNPDVPGAQWLASHRSLVEEYHAQFGKDPVVKGAGEFLIRAGKVGEFNNKSNTFHGTDKNTAFAEAQLKKKGLKTVEKTVRDDWSDPEKVFKRKNIHADALTNEQDRQRLKNLATFKAVESYCKQVAGAFPDAKEVGKVDLQKVRTLLIDKIANIDDNSLLDAAAIAQQMLESFNSDDIALAVQRVVKGGGSGSKSGTPEKPFKSEAQVRSALNFMSDLLNEHGVRLGGLSRGDPSFSVKQKSINGQLSSFLTENPSNGSLVPKAIGKVLGIIRENPSFSSSQKQEVWSSFVEQMGEHGVRSAEGAPVWSSTSRTAWDGSYVNIDVAGNMLVIDPSGKLYQGQIKDQLNISSWTLESGTPQHFELNYTKLKGVADSNAAN